MAWCAGSAALGSKLGVSAETQFVRLPRPRSHRSPDRGTKQTPTAVAKGGLHPTLAEIGMWGLRLIE